MKKYHNGEFTIKNTGEEVTLFGWVNKKRNIGKMVFVDLRDRSGIIQVVFNESELKGDYQIADKLRNEYCLKVTGTINKRSDVNPNLKTGEIELIASSLEVLSESLELPFNIYDEAEPTEETALKYRFLDLRRQKLQKTLMLRHKITKAFRTYLDDNGFIDFETPILCKSTPEGARDYLVPSRIYPGSFFALPQSPQLFKQILMIGGFEKYYQIAKCFRDEDLRADRQPEFTQIDIEMSFVEEKDVLTMAEALMKFVVKESINKTIAYEFPKITYQEAMNSYGTDKPDTRFELKLKDITNLFTKTEMKIFKDNLGENHAIKCLVVKDNKYSRSDLDRLTEDVLKYKAKGLIWLKYENDELTGPIVKNLEPEILNNLKDDLKLENNDLVLIIADQLKVVNQALGALRLKIAQDYDLIDEDKLNFLFVTDFPMFEYSETEDKYSAAHHPFTMPESIEKLNDQENCLSSAYDIVLNGYELGSGSIRIHDHHIQSAVFKALGISEEEARVKFGFFLDALKYGTPPHGGIALGLDRVVMILAKTNNIKDVVAFPKTQTTSDLMTEAPSIVSEKQLKELGLKIEKSDK